MLGLVTDQLSSGQPRQQTAARTAAWTAALQHVDHWQVVEVEATVTTSPGSTTCSATIRKPVG